MGEGKGMSLGTRMETAHSFLKRQKPWQLLLLPNMAFHKKDMRSKSVKEKKTAWRRHSRYAYRLKNVEESFIITFDT